eukprot:73843-Prorocentrum_minimum.AAC.3
MIKKDTGWGRAHWGPLGLSEGVLEGGRPSTKLNLLERRGFGVFKKSEAKRATWAEVRVVGAAVGPPSTVGEEQTCTRDPADKRTGIYERCHIFHKSSCIDGAPALRVATATDATVPLDRTGSLGRG